MRDDTRKKFNAYVQAIARLNNVDNATQKFNVTPRVQQTLETKIQESSAFLARINIMPVRELVGEKLGLGISGPIASRTDTTKKDRQTRDLHTLDSTGYQLYQTNYDTHIRYNTLDSWAMFQDFQTRIRDNIIQRQALDRMVIGWHGLTAAADTDIEKYPMLEDVNKGWLQIAREFNGGAQVMHEIKAGSGKVKIGKDVGLDEGYKNLDALVYDVVNSLLEPWYREGPGLVVLCSRETLSDKYFPLINSNLPPTEINAADLIISQKRIGDLQAIAIPYFPQKKLVITRLDNLSIYYQDGSRRRTLVDNAKRDQYEDYQSSNDGYVIERMGEFAAVENIELEAA
jgi:P2 family phage major capsid protein